MRRAWLLCCAVGIASTAHANPLSFQDAIERAASEGPTIASSTAAADAKRREIGPAGQLPDPELALALDNVPVSGIDRYRLDRDEMTMQRVGIMQQMPNGLHARKAVAIADAERADADLQIARLKARLGAGDAWINLHFALARQSVLNQFALDARTYADATRARLSSGAGTVDDALSASADAARADDRKSEIIAAIATARADMRRWLGDIADQPLADEAPSFTVSADELRDHLRRHPELLAFDAEIAKAKAGVDLARAGRRPDWSWELSYQHRDPTFGDMASVEIRVGLPLLQPWRQGPMIAARRADVTRADYDRAAMLREHQALLETRLAQYVALRDEVERAHATRLPLARQREATAIAAHAAGTQTLAQLFAARRDARETELDVLNMEEQLALLGATLTIEYGDAS